MVCILKLLFKLKKLYIYIYAIIHGSNFFTFLFQKISDLTWLAIAVHYAVQ